MLMRAVVTASAQTGQPRRNFSGKLTGSSAFYRRVAAGAHIAYKDQAMTPLTEDETQILELFTHNKSAREAVDRARKIKTLTALGSSAVQSTA